MKQYLFLIFLGLFAGSGCIAPDQYRLLENRVAALENDGSRQVTMQQTLLDRESQLKENIDKIELQIGENTKNNRENYAEIRYEIQQVKEKFQQMEGLIEEINHKFGSNSQERQDQLEKQLSRLDNSISRNYEKILKLEKYMGFEPTAAKSDESEKAFLEKEPEKISEQQLYDYAKKLFDEGDMETARIQFENFINKYPGSKNADNARFWIADSYYVEKWYEKAILEYQKVLEDYPDSNKAIAARLKQGYSFAALGEKANARLILNELVKRHPDSNEAKYALEKLKGLN